MLIDFKFNTRGFSTPSSGYYYSKRDVGDVAWLHDIRCPEGGDPLKTIDEIVDTLNNYSATDQYHSVVHTVVAAAGATGAKLSFEGIIC